MVEEIRIELYKTWTGTTASNFNNYFSYEDYLSHEEEEQIKLSLKEIEEGKYQTFTIDEYLKHLDELDKEDE